MKRIFTLSTVILLCTLFLASCVKEQFSGPDNSYWMNKERAEVVYSDAYCNYYVVDTYNGYAVIRSYAGYKPYVGAVIYGDFSHAGTRDMYNYSNDIVFTGSVTDYWLSYDAAQSALDYYCPISGGKQARVFSDHK